MGAAAGFAEKITDRLAFDFSFQIPESGFDAGENRGTEADAAPEIPAVIHPLPKFGDIHAFNLLTDQDRFEKLDDPGDKFGAEIAGVSFAQAQYFRVGMDFDEGCAAEFAQLKEERITGARPGEEDGFDVGNFHAKAWLGY